MTNTDAEGRMVLADALVHADLTLDPDVLVDVATLTVPRPWRSAARTAPSSAPTTTWPPP